MAVRVRPTHGFRARGRQVRARQGAAALDLPTDPEGLRRHVENPKEFTRLVAALVRSSLNGDVDRILEDASH